MHGSGVCFFCITESMGSDRWLWSFCHCPAAFTFPGHCECLGVGVTVSIRTWLTEFPSVSLGLFLLLSHAALITYKSHNTMLPGWLLGVIPCQFIIENSLFICLWFSMSVAFLFFLLIYGVWSCACEEFPRVFLPGQILCLWAGAHIMCLKSSFWLSVFERWFC